MAQSLECICCRCILNKELTYEFPVTLFPIYKQEGVQEFNVLDVDRTGGTVLTDHSDPDSLVFKQRPLDGRYSPSRAGVRPLTALHTSFLDYDKVFRRFSTPDVGPSQSEQLVYYKTMYRNEGVPEKLISELVEETAANKEVPHSLEILQGSRLAYSSVDPVCVDGYHGNIYHTSGTEDAELCISALIDPAELFAEKYADSETWKDFLWASRRTSTHHSELVCRELLPSPAREISCTSVHGRRMVAVKCMHQCLLYEDMLQPNKFLDQYLIQVGEDFVPDVYLYDVPALKNLFLVKCDCQVSAVAASPYHCGEMVVVMETGEIRLCYSETDKSMVVQEAIGDVATVGSPHWWSCTYGPHPKQIILAEQASLGIVDTRSPGGTTSLLSDSASQWKTSDLITALKPHPHNPMECVVATSNTVMVVDVRMKREPMLCISHELEDRPCYLDVVMNRDTLITSAMVGSRKSETTVVNFAGGCARMGSAVAPPHCTTLPHTLPGHSALKPKLHPLFGSRRVEQKVALKGTCFGHCFGDQLTSLELTVYDDLFSDQWTYSSVEGVDRGERRVESLLVDVWCKEADEFEKKALMKRGERRPMPEPHNWRTLSQYVTAVDSPSDVCLRCFTYCDISGANVSEVAAKATKMEGRCCVCSKAMVPGFGDADRDQVSLADILAVRLGKSRFPHSDLGRRLLENWPSPKSSGKSSAEGTQTSTQLPGPSQSTQGYQTT